MDKLFELEKQINEYLEVVVEDNVIDSEEIIQLAKIASSFVSEMEKDGNISPEEQEAYERISIKLKELFRKYEVVD